MEGSEVGTMDGRILIKWDLEPSHYTLRSRPHRLVAGAGEQVEALRARLIAATVETLAEGSHPRLDGTGNTPVAA
jgi:hypothetical protein